MYLYPKTLCTNIIVTIHLVITIINTEEYYCSHIQLLLYFVLSYQKSPSLFFSKLKKTCWLQITFNTNTMLTMKVKLLVVLIFHTMPHIIIRNLIGLFLIQKTNCFLNKPSDDKNCVCYHIQHRQSLLEGLLEGCHCC